MRDTKFCCMLLAITIKVFNSIQFKIADKSVKNKFKYPNDTVLISVFLN